MSNMEKTKSQFTDTTYRKYQNSSYEKTADGWVKKVDETQVKPQESAKKEYTDEELAEYAKKASDESLRKAGSGRDERMRIAAKKELLRRKNEGMPEPEKSENPFDEGMEKGLFDNFPTKTVLGKEYINKGQGWEILEKGKKAAIGEVRVWSGEKYQRTKDGWTYLGKASGGTKPSNKEKVESPDSSKSDTAISEKPAWDKDWPESVDKLTNRADYETLYDAAKEVATEVVKRQFPTDEMLLEAKEKDFAKYEWEKPKGWDEKSKEDKMKEVALERDYRIRSEIRDILRDKLSKTAQIANIKGAWRALRQQQKADRERADYESFLATNEGAAGERELGEKIKTTLDEWDSKENEIYSEAKDNVLSLIKAFPFVEDFVENSTVRINEGSFKISDSKSFAEVEISWEKPWLGRGEREYSVTANGYGRVKPGDIKAQAVILQGLFLSEHKLQETVKESVEKFENVSSEYSQKMNELKEQNPKYDWDTVYKKYSGK